MMSEKPEYNEKIEMMHALGPVAFLSHCFSPAIRVIAPFIYWIEVLAFVQFFFNNFQLLLFTLQKVASLLGIDYIAPSDEFLVLAGKDLCRDRVPTQIICENLLFLIMGYTSDQLNTVG